MDSSKEMADKENSPGFFEKGKVLFVEEEPSDSFYLIKSGEVKVFKEQKEGFALIGVCGSKSLVGEAKPFTLGKRRASAIVTEDTEAYVIKKDEAINVIKSCPPWIEKIIETLSDKLCDTFDMMIEHKIVYAEEEKQSVMNQEELSQYKKILDDHKAHEVTL